MCNHPRPNEILIKFGSVEPVESFFFFFFFFFIAFIKFAPKSIHQIARFCFKKTEFSSSPQILSVHTRIYFLNLSPATGMSMKEGQVESVF